jgi:cytochrome c peroxidase
VKSAMKSPRRALLLWSLAAGCTSGWEPGAEGGDLAVHSGALQVDDGDDHPAQRHPRSAVARGRKLFRHQTFEGNGRTCETCHVRATGALSPQNVRRAFREDPAGPLFRPLDGDGGLPGSYTRLLSRATILVTIQLHPNVRLKDDPDARSVVVERGVPTTFDKHPALEPLLMLDGRERDLAIQADHAVASHAQPGRAPQPGELEDIAAFERTLFSSPALEDFARGGPAPVLPEGCTPSERRGRRFFVDAPFAPETTGLTGFCAWCHSGPMLNTTNAHNPLQPAGGRFSNAFVSVFNKSGRPERTYLFQSSRGVEEATSPDPGRGLLTGDRRLVNTFRIPTLWGSSRTAPFFHDNSAETLEEMVIQYDDLIRRIIGVRLEFAARFTAQDMADIVAFMRLL